MDGLTPYAERPDADVSTTGATPAPVVLVGEELNYTYTRNLPYTSQVANNREMYRLPRSILLPPYLATNPYFVDFTDAIDVIFDQIEAEIDALKNIRNMWVTTKELELKSQSNLMIGFADWGGPDRATVISQVNMLGMKLSSSGLIAEQGFRAIAKFLGQFWFEKGTKSVIDFLNFCMGANFTITQCWTENYVDFYPTGDLIIGDKIWDDPPGPWYPTTHVNVVYPADSLINDPLEISKFLYEVINYNLVVNLLSGEFNFTFSGGNQVYVAVALESRQWDNFVTPSYSV